VLNNARISNVFRKFGAIKIYSILFFCLTCKWKCFLSRPNESKTESPDTNGDKKKQAEENTLIKPTLISLNREQ